MKIQDFANMQQFEQIISNWAVATGLAAVAIDIDGKYISKQYNFTPLYNFLKNKITHKTLSHV